MTVLLTVIKHFNFKSNLVEWKHFSGIGPRRIRETIVTVFYTINRELILSVLFLYENTEYQLIRINKSFNENVATFIKVNDKQQMYN